MTEALWGRLRAPSLHKEQEMNSPKLSKEEVTLLYFLQGNVCLGIMNGLPKDKRDKTEKDFDYWVPTFLNKITSDEDEYEITYSLTPKGKERLMELKVLLWGEDWGRLFGT